MAATWGSATTAGPTLHEVSHTAGSIGGPTESRLVSLRDSHTSMRPRSYRWRMSQVTRKGVRLDMKRLLPLAAGVSALLLLATAAGASTARHTVDLATGRVDGHSILGLSTAQVAAILGRPDFRAGTKSRPRIGWGPASNFELEVLFQRSGGSLRATTVVFERGPVVDSRAGSLLIRRPPELQSILRSRYDGSLVLIRPYKCRQSICTGEFAFPRSGVHLTFGSTHDRGTFLSLWKPSA